ncbi:hypothetical protein QBC37DRAFT_476687 [Rhypophila decipiens]|uniref:Uncharacterized protein n=1 Tax=Rhypophila decipiens TaxID=261697 RepID=A0AAN7AZD7_9PEZI|nr:hypothetical protein QBC37DRAFT_476687 [Rhypophila decipiens]
MWRLKQVSNISFFTTSVNGQNVGDDHPIWVQGALEGATATDNSYNTGGTIAVNCFTMNVPKNLLVQFPAAWVPWKDFIGNKTDFLGFETLVMGNTIEFEPRVGQIVITEFFEGENIGMIQSINYTDGSMQIQNGTKVRISDPNAVFSVGYDGAPMMTADDQSPSITSFSGFPMCIARNSSDPLCPLSNRPTATTPSRNRIGTFNAPDPYVAAPFLPGDFIIFSGFGRLPDEIIAYSIVAQDVQIKTPLSSGVVYVRIALALLGIWNPNPITELADSRLIGYVSNPAATILLYALDIDPGSGEIIERIIASVGLRGGGNFENKFEYRAEILFGYTRKYKAVVLIDGRPLTKVTKNGFLAGTYVQPVNVWVPGEQDIPGMEPPTFDFTQMEFLTKGVGPDRDGNVWEPLDPFPQTGFGVPIGPPDCTGLMPLAKRRTFGGRIALYKENAVADGANKKTEEAVVNAVPDQLRAIEEKKRLDYAKEVAAVLFSDVERELDEFEEVGGLV